MKVLVVEDDKKIALAIKRGLEQEGMVVDVRYDGESGYDLAASGEYEVLVLDLMLPKMDGVTVCRSLREDGVGMPVLMLTAKGRVRDRVTGLNCGADDYLVKPFAFAELVARVRALVRRPQKNQGVVLQVGNLKLDMARLKVERADREIKLTKRELAMLEFLMRNMGQVLTKDQIISRVWEYDSEVLPNTVEVYMKYLREKVDKPFDGPNLLKTVRGFGYKIEDGD